MNKMLSVQQSFVDKQLTLLNKGTMADFTIEVRNTNNHKQFSVHKCLLAAHSEVFRAMFTHDNIRESIERRLVIEEFSPSSVLLMLLYVYTGRVETEDLRKHSEELLKLSEKYELLHLKSMCLSCLESLIENKTVCQMLVLADMFNAKTLMNACVAFLGSKWKDVTEVISSDEWAELKESNPRLVNDVLESLVLVIVNEPYRAVRVVLSHGRPSSLQ